MRDTGCDVWFPFYPLCVEHCITETYDMAYECYRRMIELYGGGNVSTCGFSPAARWRWASRRTTMRSLSLCRSRGTLSLFLREKYRGTMPKGRGCKR